MNTHKTAIVIHGGAGALTRENVTEELQREYEHALTTALRQGQRILEAGDSALDAVVGAITMLEDSPLFNAGRGSVLTHDETIEMDAAVMCGETSLAGAVTRVTTIKNPITAARAVMERSQHVLLSGAGAEQLAQMAGCEVVDPSYFVVPLRREQLKQVQAQERTMLDHDGGGPAEASSAAVDFSLGSTLNEKFGTVGAVALDMQGNLAAGTSTGGMTNKRYGRIGDSPIIGAGTYADNATCAISCTGHGEFFMRHVVAYDVAALMKYKGLSLEHAAQHVVHEKLLAVHGRGGLIGLDRAGNVAMPFNTPGMYRGMVGIDGVLQVAIFGDSR
jgi:beta-aspartyl-peptidase (threonine type)